MDLNDITPTNFFKKVTFASDPTPAGKLAIPDGQFIQSAILLLLVEEIKKLK